MRNSIESVDKGAEIGFLSGNEEKFRIYNMALYDTLEFIAKKRTKKRDVMEPQVAIEKDKRTHDQIQHRKTLARRGAR